jgi:Bacterial extracellular solute-binding protein, family 7
LTGELRQNLPGGGSPVGGEFLGCLQDVLVNVERRSHALSITHHALDVNADSRASLVETMKAFGANPVPMQWGEVYLAMKQGTIDGLDLPATTVTSDKFHEITKYYSITRHSYPPGIWTMAAAKYNALPDDLKKVIDESMQAACAQHRGRKWRPSP